MRHLLTLVGKIILFLFGSAILSVFPVIIFVLRGGTDRHPSDPPVSLAMILFLIAIVVIPLILIALLGWVLFGKRKSNA